MADVGLSGVKKSYGTSQVIHGIDLEIAEGAFVVIVGPSGCGKSTLLRMIAGLETITEGEIRIGGRRVNDLEPKDRNVAMVFQNYALYPHMTVFDNMAYGLKIARIPKPEIVERVTQAARILELEPLLKRKPRQLSGGQRQRVAMGRAIVRDPAVFLFDEPLSNLDAKLRVQMRLEIKQLQRRLGTTSVYVTHDQVEAMTLADLLVVMNQGVAEQIDAPLALYERPASLFVAGFIGSPAMNFLRGAVESDGRGVALAAGPRIPVASAALSQLAGREVVIGIRPEHLEERADGPLAIAVELLETLGADTLAHGKLDGAAVTIRLPGSRKVESGARLALAPHPGSLHLFDPESGKRLVDL